MTRRLQVAAAVAIVVGCIAGGVAVVAATAGEAGDKCCFTNTRFTGVCEVTLGEDESCSDVLGYLNNPNSVGRSYCGNTKIRGGWAQVSCE